MAAGSLQAIFRNLNCSHKKIIRRLSELEIFFSAVAKLTRGLTIFLLADLFKTVKFSIPVKKDVGGVVANKCRLGTPVGKTSGLRFDYDGVAENFVRKKSLKLENSFVVPTVPNEEMVIEGGARLFPSEKAGYTWKSLDLATARSVLLTSRLSGCTFAMGVRGTTLYLGHGQCLPQAGAGAILGDSIAEGAVFDGLTPNFPPHDRAIFLIRPVAQDAAPTANTIGYDTGRDNVSILGLAVSEKVFFIVQKTSGSASDAEVLEVDLIEYDGSTKGSKQWERRVVFAKP